MTRAYVVKMLQIDDSSFATYTEVVPVVPVKAASPDAGPVAATSHWNSPNPTTESEAGDDSKPSPRTEAPGAGPGRLFAKSWPRSMPPLPRSCQVVDSLVSALML